MSKIVKVTDEKPFLGCDFAVQLGIGRKNSEIRLLQLTDMQAIDSTQRRTSDRIFPDQIEAWTPDKFDALCGNHIRSLVAQTEPDLIFITGDIIYGSFDDDGTVFEHFFTFMESLQIPWAPVFGNHDNESRIGVLRQCRRFEDGKYCLFKRGNVSGNGNYTVGIAIGGELVRVLHMIDSNGCSGTDDANVIKDSKIFSDQLELFSAKNAEIERAQGRKVPAFTAFHIPTEEFKIAESAKGYSTPEKQNYVLGVDVQPKDSDFGFRLENYSVAQVEGDFLSFLKSCNVDGVFCGHCHSICTCILHEGIRWVFGLKTGQYDYHIPGSCGGTLITLRGDGMQVRHIPALVPYSPFPKSARMFKNFFVE